MNEELSRVLTAEVADPPRSTVDVDGAVRTARRIRRRRRVAATAVAALALATGGVGVGVRTLAGTEQRRATPATTASAGPAAAPASFDPTVRRLSFGALPEHVPTGVYQLTRTTQAFHGADSRRPKDLEFGLFVTVYARGERAPTGRHGDAGRPAAPVHGRPARCLTSASAGCTELAFQYLPGAWALVDYRPAVPAASTPRTVRRIAGSVRLTAGAPVRMPFRLGGTVSGWVPADSTSPAGPAGPVYADLSLNEPHRRDHYPQESVTIFVARDDLGLGSTGTVVDGRPAKLVLDTGTGNTLSVQLPGGLAVTISLRPGLTTDPREVYRKMHLVSRVADVSDWVPPLA